MGTIKRQWVRIVNDEPKYEGPPPDCIIYFVQCQQTKLVKIGYAKDPWMRLSNMQVGCPTYLKMVALVRKPKTYEAELHERFATHRHHGEWFNPDPELLALTKEYADEYERTKSIPGDPFVLPSERNNDAA